MYEPLYKRVRPKSIDEVVGQRHLLGEGAPLRSILERGSLFSMLFYGPPGTGKTLVAELMAKEIEANFVKLSAPLVGISDIKKVAEDAEKAKRWGTDTVLFLDEIHRFNRAQQDVLLPYVEEGLIILIGASTENPIFALNSALVSRLLVFEFKPLTQEELVQILRRALSQLGDVDADEAALRLISEKAGGDARKALSILEVALGASGGRLDEEGVLKVLGGPSSIRYDRQEHYDVISAFIKSLRGSDPDAALYWLSVMLEAGEDPLYITRRLMILAAEDVGMADPLALLIATSAHQALSHVGMPEGELILAFATVYLATAPKSNSCYQAIRKVQDFVKKHPDVRVPVHLRDAHSWQKRGAAEKYLYPHDYAGGFVKQRYMPHDEVFYIPKLIGREEKVAKRLKALWPERYSEKKNA